MTVPVTLMGKFRSVIIKVYEKDLYVNLRGLVRSDTDLSCSYSDVIYVRVALVVQRIGESKPSCVAV